MGIQSDFEVTGAEKLYFLNLTSDIYNENLGQDLIIKRVGKDDYANLFGVTVSIDDTGSITRLSITNNRSLYADAPRIFDINDPIGINFYKYNYLIHGKTPDVRASVEKIDCAIRLFSTGSSGISNGFSQNSFEYFYPQPNWHELPYSEINKSDIPNILLLSNQINEGKDSKIKLLIDRYKNATQSGSSGIKPHNRFIDLITILEILFVSDGSYGEISYKLRMRGSIMISKILNKSRIDVNKLIKDFYNKRSRIVHGNEKVEISREEWFELCTICRRLILKYLIDPSNFTTEKLDNSLLE